MSLYSKKRVEIRSPCYSLDKSRPYGAVIETARVSRDMRRNNGNIVSYQGRRKQGGKGEKLEISRTCTFLLRPFLRIESIIMTVHFGIKFPSLNRIKRYF